MGNVVNADGLLKFIEFGEVEIDRLSQEVKLLETSQKEEFDRIGSALQSIRGAFEKDKENIYKRLETLEQTVEGHGKEIEGHGKAIEGHDKEIEAIKLAMKSK